VAHVGGTVGSEEEVGLANVSSIFGSDKRCLHGLAEVMRVVLVLCSRLVVDWVSTEVVVGHAVSRDSVPLRLEVKRLAWSSTGEAVVVVRCRAVGGRCVAHREVSDTHVRYLADVSRSLLVQLAGREGLARRCLIGEGRRGCPAEAEVGVPGSLLELGHRSLSLSDTLNVDGTWPCCR